MARLITSLATKDVTSETQLVVVHTQRFNKVQWDHLRYVQQLTGCTVQEYIRRLVDADRKESAKKK